MERKEPKPLALIALCIVAIGVVLTGLSMVSMRMAYHRAYTEIASSCERMSLVVVGESKYFCAPVARVEMAGPRSEFMQAEPNQSELTRRDPMQPEPTQSPGRAVPLGTRL